MAYIAVDKQGGALILSDDPFRVINTSTTGYWATKSSKLYIPRWLVKKLIGRDLTWEDEAVLLKEKDDSTNPSEIFTPEFLEEIGFVLVHKVESTYDPNEIYGCAVDKRVGMTHLYWNEKGHSCTYFGELLESNVSFSIRKDGDTRYAFNGYVFNQNDVRKLLSLTW